jgi:hypothetical protein
LLLFLNQNKKAYLGFLVVDGFGLLGDVDPSPVRVCELDGTSVFGLDEFIMYLTFKLNYTKKVKE